MAALSMLGACNQPSTPAAGAGDKFAGLDTQILQWRLGIIAADPLCKSQAEGQKCNGFEVACKAERVVSPQDQAKGVTAHVVAAMTWEGWDPKLRQVQSGARAAQFTKTGAGWTRVDHAPVNLSSCADL
jgi:hypothetical protein